MMLQCSTRGPQNPSQDHENDSNKGKVVSASSVGDHNYPSPGAPSLWLQGAVRDREARGKDHGWEGYCTTRKSKERAGRQGVGGWGACC